jgi:hypothetical protein
VSFRTSSGYIGMALIEIKASDTVWLLNCGRVPYILRKRPRDGPYEFFRDCYLHGVMLGEDEGGLEKSFYDSSHSLIKPIVIRFARCSKSAY